jgi:von Hippel-Lindau disease tumor supressor
VMSGWSNNTSGCDCSGHGECYNGTCVCEVQYDGASCHEPNMPYFVAFASIFYVICAVTLLQLVCCIRAEFRRMKTPSLLRACRITTQKALYVLVFMASASRAFYFSMETTSLNWASNLLNAYYPIILTGFSLLVCFWAEVFHLQNIKWERPRFLSKSFFGFLTFNVITYSVLIAEIVCKQYYTHSSEHDKIFFTHVFNSCYALLLFVVVIFFLIYGVEVYFKVRGGFLMDASSMYAAGEDNQDAAAAVGLLTNQNKVHGGFSTTATGEP